jgi:glucose-1-phosphate cytidylyltransferase
MTAARPEGRFGSITFGDTKKDQIVDIKEKQDNLNQFVNAGFFVVNKEAIKYIKSVNEQWENAPLKKIAKNGQLMGFKHRGFWKPMDTLRDKIFLDDLAKRGKPPWQTW